MISPTRWVAIALSFALSTMLASSGLAFVVQSGSGQSAPSTQAPKQEGSVRLRTDEVVVDASVTDKKGRPVMNLTSDDFDVFEDGVKQRIASFQAQSTGQTTEAQAPGAGATQVAARRGAPGKLVAMVFDSQT